MFSDADKAWYKNYFDAVFPKLEAAGCHATHNVWEGVGVRGNGDYAFGFDFGTPDSADEEGYGCMIHDEMMMRVTYRDRTETEADPCDQTIQRICACIR